MGRASIKSNDPIPLPHDGPLHSLLDAGQIETLQLENYGVTQKALEWLQPTKKRDTDDSNDDDNSNNDDDKEYRRIQQLLLTLQTAPKIKDQLQALQIFRSQSQALVVPLPTASLPPKSSTRFHRSVLYRILLEWFLSCQTPLPLRRAIQANLEGLVLLMEVKDSDSEELMTPGTNGAMTCGDLQVHVLQSLFLSSSNDEDEKKSTLVATLIQSTDPLHRIWRQPLHSLHEALNYARTHDTLLLDDGDHRTLQVLECLQAYAVSHLQPLLRETMMANNNNTDIAKQSTDSEAATTTAATVVYVDEEVTGAMQRAIQWANILKTVLADAPSLAIPTIVTTAMPGDATIQQKNPPPSDQLLRDFQDFVWQLLTSRITPTDALSKLGMAYSRVLLLRKPPILAASSSPNNGNKNTCLSTHLSELITKQQKRELPPLIGIALVQGLTATVPIPLMLYDSNALLAYFQEQSLQADPGVRLAALKGIHTLISRCLTRAISRNSSSPGGSSDLEEEVSIMQTLTEGTLEIVLKAWESPPNRQLGNAIPSLFEKLVNLMQKLGRQSDQKQEDGASELQQQGAFQGLVKRLLAQPSNRKGRYKALETLLPIVGSRSMIALGREWKLMESLLEGIGDRNSHSAGTIADLWQKILTDLLQDMLANGEISSSDLLGAAKNGDNKNKQRRKTEYAPEVVQEVLQKWCDAWIPSLAAALLSSAPSRRKHIAQFCLPRIATMVGGRKKQDESSITFSNLIRAIDHLKESACSGKGDALRLGGVRDSAIWGILEAIRYSNVEKIVNNTPQSEQLLGTIATCMPLETLKYALKHFLLTVRLVSFQVIRPLVQTYSSRQNGDHGVLNNIDEEISLWKEAFPYAIMTEGIEYRSSLLECLTLFIDRISSEESAVSETTSEESTVLSLSRLHSFVVDFLIFDVAVQKAAYPASTAEKEAFAIELLDLIIAFASRDNQFVTKNLAVYNRRRSPEEEKTATAILEALLSREALSSVMSLMTSVWDGTRTSSFRLLSRLMVVGHNNSVQLSEDFASPTSRLGMEARAVYLASSPRQREADQGARFLAFLYFSLPSPGERRVYLEKLVKVLEKRLGSMKRMLAALLSGEIDPCSSDGGKTLPLAHGLVHALRLIVQHIKMESKDMKQLESTEKDDTLESMALIFCQAIQVSLTVVADMKDGEVIDGMDGDLVVGAQDGGANNASTPLNVNTGAIGANGTFSSVKASKKEEQSDRIAIQRVVMGSWLLTRETCAALAVLLASGTFKVSQVLMDRAGMLLISTLVSLKHAGAAFAAHRALQEISLVCYKSRDLTLGKLPSKWANRLLEEISETEKVRDSTLRRSTGYGLGFLALMRSEVSSRADSRSLCAFILSKLLRLSLPPNDELQSFFSKLNLSRSFLNSAFPHIATSESLNEQTYEIRSRVHALNILRLIILDAPLANEVGPIIGDATIAAVTGYSDKTWAVRNSSTMVFAAAMVRTVDADKNATITDMTGSNAVTVGELFRCYPSLAPFLNAVLVSGEGLTQEDSKGTSTPSMFPILLLLSRVQPVSNSEPESSEVSEPFIGGVFKSLLDRHYAIRTAASLTLANLCSGEGGQSASSLSAMLAGCHSLLVDGATRKDWNAVHGALLGIKGLVTRFSASGGFLHESGLAAYFLKVTTDGAGPYVWPPICISEVLHIFAILPAPSGTTDFWSQQIEGSYESTVALLNKSQPTSDGSTELATTTAVIWCTHLVPSVWDLFSNDKEALSKLSLLLSSDIIDIRLHASKAFKKTIYKSIDNLLATGSVATDVLEERLVEVSWIVAKAIQQELARSSESSIHPPTLRRLSRCFLECVGAYHNLSQRKVPMSRDLRDAMAAIAGSLIEQDHCLDDDDAIRRETPLAGNGLELMSFVIAEQKEAGDLGEGAFEEIICSFVSTVCRLNDPRLSWRLRHSAAVSIENSKLLSWNDGTNNNMKQAHHNLLEEILTMLQDQDPDVRCSAGRVIQVLKVASNNMQRLPFVSQLVLEQAYQLAYELPTDGGRTGEVQEYTTHLLQGIFDRCQGTESKLKLLQEELTHTHTSSVELDQILNVGTERKIFEDEVANPYEESALASQLAVRSLLQFPPDTLAEKASSPASSLAEQCERLISIVKINLEDNQADDLLHQVTRSSAVFVELHSLIVVSAVIVYLGRQSDGASQRLATHTLAIPTSKKQLHPSVFAALSTLARAEAGSDATRKQILQCLFLLPI